MPTADELRALTGRRVMLRLVPEAGDEEVAGRIVGTLDADDGLVVVFEREGSPGRRFSCNYQHIAFVETREP
jgi:hypothetical protein